MQIKGKVGTAATVTDLRNQLIASRNQKTSDASDYRYTTYFSQRNSKMRAAQWGADQPKIDSLRLQRLSNLEGRRSKLHYPLKVLTACSGCGGLNCDDQIQESLGFCRNCLSIDAKVEAAFDKQVEQQKREQLAKLIGGKQ